MINNLKKRISEFVIKRRFLKTGLSEVNFNGFFSNSIRFLIIMPSDEKDFHYAFDILKYLLIHRKSITLVCLEPRINTIPEKDKYKIVSYRLDNISKFDLPRKEFLEKLQLREYDVVIDLNLHENLFCSAFSNFVKSKFRVGFQKKLSDRYYNFQVQNDKINPEISYRNLLNSLQMF